MADSSEEDPPIYIPPDYEKLRKEGKDVVEFGMGKYGRPIRVSWLDIQLGRRESRRFFTGRLRAKSIIQTIAMVLGGTTLLLLLAFLILNFTLVGSLDHISVAWVFVSWFSLWIGLVGFFSLFNGIASFVKRSWRYERDEISTRHGIEEHNVITSLFRGQWRTQRPYIIGMQIVLGACLMTPLMLTLGDVLQLTSQAVEADIREVLLFDAVFVSIGLLPLFLSGYMMIVNGLLNIWRVVRGDYKSGKVKRARRSD